MSKIGNRVLAVLFVVEGFFYVAYTVWKIVLNRLELYRAPPLLETLAYGFFVVMLGVGIFLVSRAFTMFVGGKMLLADHYVSVLSFFLWSFPAAISFGNAYTYFTTAPLSLRHYAYSNLETGMLFAIIGSINILSLICMGLLRLKKDTPAFRTRKGNTHS